MLWIPLAILAGAALTRRTLGKWYSESSLYKYVEGNRWLRRDPNAGDRQSDSNGMLTNYFAYLDKEGNYRERTPVWEPPYHLARR